MAKITAQEYNGKMQLSVRLHDLRPGRVPQEQAYRDGECHARRLRGETLRREEAEALLPTREEIGTVYRFLRRSGGYPFGPEALFFRLMETGIGYGRILVALDVLEELGFLTRRMEAGAELLAVNPDAPKADLSTSHILASLAKSGSETLVKQS